MSESTIERVQQTTAQPGGFKKGVIVYLLCTGGSFCLNEAGLRLLRRLEQGMSERVVTGAGAVQVIRQLEHAQALERTNGELRLRPENIRLYDYAEESKYLQTPMSVMLEVTPACDLHCIYCCVAEVDERIMGRALSRPEMANVVTDIASAGISWVTITGGEPLLRQRSHGDLFDLVRQFRAHNIRVSLFTNGTMLADYADLILESGIAEISVSLDASTPQLFEQLARRPLFERVVAGLRAIARRHILIRVAMVVTHLNHQDWPNMLELVHEMGLDALMMLRAYPIGRACKDPSFIVKDAQWLEITRAVLAYARDKGYRMGGGRELEGGVLHPFSNCKAGTTFCIVNYDGTVCPCCGFKTTWIGDLRARSFKEVWESSNWALLRDKQFVCPVPDRDVIMVSMPR